MKRFRFALLVILIAFFGLCIYKGTSKAITPQSDTATSRLTLEILPALEVDLLSTEKRTSPNWIEATFNLGVRSNTAWTLSYAVQESNLSSPATCQTGGELGRRNLNNSQQRISLSCQQALSWGDKAADQELAVTYSVAAILP